MFKTYFCLRGRLRKCEKLLFVTLMIRPILVSDTKCSVGGFGSGSERPPGGARSRAPVALGDRQHSLWWMVRLG